MKIHILKIEICHKILYLNFIARGSLALKDTFFSLAGNFFMLESKLKISLKKSNSVFSENVVDF